MGDKEVIIKFSKLKYPKVLYDVGDEFYCITSLQSNVAGLCYRFLKKQKIELIDISPKEEERILEELIMLKSQANDSDWFEVYSMTELYKKAIKILSNYSKNIW